MEKMVSFYLSACSVLLVIIVLVIAYVFPIANMEEWTDNYTLYKEVKNYTKISELEEHLKFGNIRHKRENNNIYIYSGDNEYADVTFIALDTECKVEKGVYTNNFEKLDCILGGNTNWDTIEDLEVSHKNGKQYISLISGKNKYTYSDGKYYVTWIDNLRLVRNVVIIGTISAVFWLFIGLYQRKNPKNSSN